MERGYAEEGYTEEGYTEEGKGFCFNDIKIFTEDSRLHGLVGFNIL